MAEPYRVRLAERSDIPAIERLIERSVRELSVSYYDAAQIESALEFMFGVDSQLVDDGTYHVIEADGELVARPADGAGGVRCSVVINGSTAPTRCSIRRESRPHPGVLRRSLVVEARVWGARCSRPACATRRLRASAASSSWRRCQASRSTARSSSSPMSASSSRCRTAYGYRS